MKKLLTFILITSLLLCGGCANHEKEDTSEYYGELYKAQEISIVPANASTAAQTLTDPQEISDFISALDLEHWELKEIPDGAKLSGTFQFSQEETILFGESETDGNLYPVCEIISYQKTPYLMLKVSSLETSFKVPEQVHEYLEQYFY